MNRMGIPRPDYTPDGVLAEIARVAPFFKGATWEGLGDNGKQWPIREGCIGTEIPHTDSFKRGLGKFPGVVARSLLDPRIISVSPPGWVRGGEFPFILTTGR